jgi:alcohol-forming fatty acyl-CoA reductase
MGVFIGAAKGVIRSMICYGENNADIVPVDVGINFLIIIAANFAMMKQK